MKAYSCLPQAETIPMKSADVPAGSVFFLPVQPEPWYPENMNIFRRNPAFKRLYLAALINRAGDAIDVMSTSWLVYQVSGSASFSALNYALNYIPTVFLQPLAGAWVTRHDRRKIMILADIGRAVLAFSLAGLFLAHTLQAWMILCATFLISALEAFRLPCNARVNMDILAPEDYSEAQSRLNAANSLSALAGSGLAGLIISAAGTGVSLCIDGGCFVLSAVILTGLSVPFVLNEDEKGRNTLALFRDGLNYIRRHETIVFLLSVSFLINALVVPNSSLASAWCASVLHQGAWALSLQSTVFALAVILSSELYHGHGDKISVTKWILFTYPAIALFYASSLLAAHAGSMFTLLLALSVPMAAAGYVIGSVNVAISVLLMHTIEPDYISRADGVMNALINAGVPLMSFVSSALSSRLALPVIYRMFFAISLVCGLIMSLISAGRKKPI